MTLAAALLVMGAAAATARPLARRLGRDAGYVLAGLFLAALLLVLTGAGTVLDGGAVTGEWSWIPALDIALRLRLDGLSLVFAILVLGVGALIMSYCSRYLSEEYDHGRLYLLLSLFATAMLGMVLASDMVLLFVFFEITTLCSFFLIGGQGLVAARPATRAFVVTASGGLALLAAVVLTWTVVGTTDLTEALERSNEIALSPQAPWIGALVILAAVTKSAQVPFHFWLPDAMVALTPVSAYLHAATLVKAGIYVLMRFSPPFTGFTWWTVTLVTLGMVTTVVGAVFALQQHDLKALLAYSTVSQLGWIVALIGVGTEDSLATAGLHTFAHALFKATLFMLVGVIDREAGSRDIRELSGLYRVMPVTAVLTGLAALSMAGLPPLLGFVSKEESYYSFLQLPGTWGVVVGVVAVLSAAITFAYGFRIMYGAFGGRTVQKKLYEPRWSFLAPAAIPAVAGLLLGLFVSSLNPLFDRAVQATVLGDAYAGLALWPGLGSVALWMSVVTVLLGLGLFAARGPVDRALQRLRLPISGVVAYDTLYAGVLRVGDAVGRPARSGALAPHLAWPLLSLLAVAGVGLALLGRVDGYPEPVSQPGDWILVVLVALACLGMALVRSRVGAVVMLGVVGFLVAGWFLLAGGVDLALTQMLVEILTVVVAVLVLRRLPRTFAPTGRARKVLAAALAACVGVAAGAATFVLTGRRESSVASQYFLDEAQEATGGTNVVNTVLVDFRGLDTFGEVTVLAAAAVGLLALLRADARQDMAARRLDSAGDRTILAATSRVLVPVIAVVSVVLLWRGHNEPGGGFIGALVAGLAVVLLRLPRAVGGPGRVPAVRLVGAGLVTAVVGGLLGMFQGSFLRPVRSSIEVGDFYQSLTTSFVFDVGVYLVVLGLVVATLERLEDGAVPGPDEDLGAPPPPARPDAVPIPTASAPAAAATAAPATTTAPTTTTGGAR